ncbi:DUF932 domain-containing protein [Pseudonocardia spirodelae]|uniref:DUF932 domain-containing protein n=1 Tax=Pseudonocardia spirodelae TaxID=3133431 RepID=A0ABU8T0H2_9PSEU
MSLGAAVPHYRDAKGGEFLVASDHERSFGPRGVPPFLRFCMKSGAAGDLDADLGGEAGSLLAAAELDWRVDHRPVLTELHEGIAPVQGYQALVRPDRGEVMGVVTSAYRVAENEKLAEAVVGLAQRHHSRAELIGAASFGRASERVLLVCRVTKLSPGEFLILLAHNRHGGEGAVRVQLVIADLAADAVLTPPARWDSYEIPHVGRMSDRLELLEGSPMIEDYLSEISGPRERLEEARWSRSRTQRLLHELWGDPPDNEPRTKEGAPLEPDDRVKRHPAAYLSRDLDERKTAYDAFRRICSFLDNESEACERGDFTKDRDERLALGAGTKLKQKAWRWLVGAVQ